MTINRAKSLALPATALMALAVTMMAAPTQSRLGDPGTVLAPAVASAPRASRTVSGLTRPAANQAKLDQGRLTSLTGKVRDGTYGWIHALLVTRRGEIVLEEYFDGWDAGRLHEVQSISKGIVSLAVGIALEQGHLESLDQTVVSFFPDLVIENAGPWKEAITIGDILRMSTGTTYEEGEPGSAHWQLNRMQRGWTQFWLDQPMAYQPGTRWHYDSGGVIALSEVFRRATGMHVDDYARANLFEPLGIERYEWERNAEGHPHAGGGLHLRARDLAKIGQLMLQRGEWRGAQVVPADWVQLSTQTKYRFARAPHPFVGYAYLWWVFAPDPTLPDGEPIVAGTGLGGQYVFWIRDYDLVVVVLGWSDDPEQALAPTRFLYDDILPTVR